MSGEVGVVQQVAGKDIRVDRNHCCYSLVASSLAFAFASIRALSAASLGSLRPGFANMPRRDSAVGCLSFLCNFALFMIDLADVNILLRAYARSISVYMYLRKVA